MRQFVAAILLALASAAPAAVHPLTVADKAAIDATVARILASTQVPAASIAVVQGGRIVYAQAYGQQAAGVPAKADARYSIASISKQITATAILRLVDRGKLSLDDKVSKWEPTLTDAEKVTVRQLLNHTSGYRDYWPQDYSFAAMAKPVSPQAVLDRWAKAPLDFPPGTQFQYSNTGYVIAGRIVEKASGRPFMDYLRAEMLTPLAMTSAVDADTGMAPADARPHTRYALGPVREAKPAAPGWLFAAGELAMTASDLARWDIGMLDKRLLSASAYKAQQTPVELPGGKPDDYGLGVTIGSVEGHRRLEHGGEAVGFLSENRVYPDDGAAIVVLDNADFGNAETAIADRIEAILFGKADETARARALFDALRSGTLDRGGLTANASYYFTPTALADYRASLSALPEPDSVARTSSALRGGFTEEVYRFRFPGRTLIAILRAEPGVNGKVEQFTIFPVG